MLSTFLSRAQSSTSEPIGWISRNDRLTNHEQKNTKGKVSLHQPRSTLSPGRHVNSRHGHDNRASPAAIKTGYSSAHPIPFLPVYLNGWWAISQKSNREKGEGERNTISNDSSTWFFIISWRHVLLWIIAWLWPLMGSLRTHNSSKIFIVGPSQLRMHIATQIWSASSAFNKTCQTAQNVQDLLTDWPFNKKLKPVSMKLKWQLEWYNFRFSTSTCYY